MVQRHSPFEKKKQDYHHLKILSNAMARCLLYFVPAFKEDSPYSTVDEVADAMKLTKSFVKEQLDLLVAKSVLTFDEDFYFISKDNLYALSEIINGQNIIILKKKVDSYFGDL